MTGTPDKENFCRLKRKDFRSGPGFPLNKITCLIPGLFVVTKKRDR